MTQIQREFTKEQLDWFEDVLKNNPQKWTIVTFHHPVYACKLNKNNKYMQEEVKPILEKYGVDLVLQGHDHTYGRGTYPEFIGEDVKNPPMYIVSVLGSKTYPLGVCFEHDRAASQTQLYQVIDIDKNTLTFNSYTVTGDLYDSFQLQKSKKGINKVIENNSPEKINQRVAPPTKYIKQYTKEDRQKYFELYNYRIKDSVE